MTEEVFPVEKSIEDDRDSNPRSEVAIFIPLYSHYTAFSSNNK